MRRLNSRMKALPGVVPNADFVGNEFAFAFADAWSDEDD